MASRKRSWFISGVVLLVTASMGLRVHSASSTGSRDVDHERRQWVFQAPLDPPLPTVGNREWPRNAIDHFILARLEPLGLAPVGDADRRTLIRRATFDLVGLPPTPQEIDAFLQDESHNAFAKVVDRLLESPHYGERWGRYWLDLVRYADTAGDNSDYPVPQLYKYRNWVIDAFNRDMPYDEFIRQQLAGDLLPSRSDQEKYSKIIATGYIAIARRFGSVVDDYPQHLTIEDTIDNVGRTFLGLTINCARCHDHKFDPITTEDYYGLYGFFHSTRYPWPGIELDKVQRDLVPLVPAEQAAPVMEERAAQLAGVDAELKRLESEKSQAAKQLKGAEEAKKQQEERDKAASQAGDTHHRVGDTPHPVGDTPHSFSTPLAARGDGPEVRGVGHGGGDNDVAARIANIRERIKELDKQTAETKKKREELEKVPLPFDTAYAVAEGNKIANAHLQVKGDPKKLGDEVARRFPTVFGGQTLPADEQGSGRMALAAWIADARNPLTARVMVNRVWQHHFGRGLASTPSDFGRQGQPATHPELLDHLAWRLIDSGWSIKAMHRLVMSSRTYQLGSAELCAGPTRIGASQHVELGSRTPDPRELDPNNAFYWRFNRRRLDAEAIRDAMLDISGQLDRTTGGAHPFPDPRKWDFTQHKPFKAVYETNRRSVYLMTQRIQRHPYLAIFDGPDTNSSTAQRVTSTSPLQALYLMNDAFVHEQARHFAERVIGEQPTDPARIERAYALAFGRLPSSGELVQGELFMTRVRESLLAAGVGSDQVARQAWESFARVLLRTSEFVYVE
jgi:hypothetical protein